MTPLRGAARRDPRAAAALAGGGGRGRARRQARAPAARRARRLLDQRAAAARAAARRAAARGRRAPGRRARRPASAARSSAPRSPGPGFLNLLPAATAGSSTRWPACSLRASASARPRSSSRCAINVEFVSANPTGPLHIGHARQAAYGDALARILAFRGYDVTREYYINDYGSQVDQARRVGARARARRAGARGRLPRRLRRRRSCRAERARELDLDDARARGLPRPAWR